MDGSPAAQMAEVRHIMSTLSIGEKHPSQTASFMSPTYRVAWAPCLLTCALVRLDVLCALSACRRWAMSCTYLHVRMRIRDNSRTPCCGADGEAGPAALRRWEMCSARTNETSMLKNLTNTTLFCVADGEAGPVSRYWSASGGRCATGVHLHHLRVPDKEPVWHQSTAATHHHLRR